MTTDLQHILSSFLAPAAEIAKLQRRVDAMAGLLRRPGQEVLWCTGDEAEASVRPGDLLAFKPATHEDGVAEDADANLNLQGMMEAPKFASVGLLGVYVRHRQQVKNGRQTGAILLRLKEVLADRDTLRFRVVPIMTPTAELPPQALAALERRLTKVHGQVIEVKASSGDLQRLVYA